MESKRVLVIGSGGREHAIALKLSQSSHVSRVFFAPGNAASHDRIEVVPLDITNHTSVVEFIVSKNIYFCIVGPEAPLADGLINSLEEAGIPCFGPRKEAAQLESSKTFAKQIMNEAGVPTAQSKYFDNEPDALRYVETCEIPIVIKADGLAAGKGVTVALDRDVARSAVLDCFSANVFGSAGSRVLIEQFLVGREASIMAIINDEHICLLPASSDYKRAYDQNEGPNTGGMGSVSPTPVFSESRLAEVREKVFLPVIRTLREKGITYRGFLYAGLMVSANGTFNVLEFNCRLGDPETQSLLLRIENDFFELIEAAIFSPDTLPEAVLRNPKTAITVVVASRGYPSVCDDNKSIKISLQNPDVVVFHAGTRRDGDQIFSKGGRILGVSTLSDSVETARAKILDALSGIHFDGMFFRRDIGTFE